MLLKSADNKDSQISVLKNLLNHKNISADKKQQIEESYETFQAELPLKSKPQMTLIFILVNQSRQRWSS
jgi:hypothetical protein